MGRQLEPELMKMCICGVVWSPNDMRKTEECPNCGAAFHLECMRQHSDLKCIECKEELPKTLVYSHLKREQVDDIREEVQAPAMKRLKTDQSVQSVKEKDPKLTFPSLAPEMSAVLDSYLS